MMKTIARRAVLAAWAGLAGAGQVPAEEVRTVDVTPAVAGTNAFAVDLYARVRSEPGNLAFSPYSLSNALAMTYAGARGETAAEMARVLHLGDDPDRLHAAHGELIRTFLGDGSPRPYQLRTANALWGQEGQRFVPAFLDLVSRTYGAGLREVDFRSTEAARRTINGWVEEQTEHRIRDLIGTADLSADALLVLTNAIYFKADWQSPFRKSSTRDADFRLAAGANARVPMMRQVGSFRILDGDREQVLELPYKGGLSMLIILPRAVDGLAEWEARLSAERLGADVARLAPQPVDVQLPRFRVEARLMLADTLAAMGMPRAFDPSRADFTGLVDDGGGFCIARVIHQAFVDVDEAGTEAAAATAVIGVRSEASVRPRPPIAFTADHPFAFAIRDGRTGCILFLGRVADPRR